MSLVFDFMISLFTKYISKLNNKLLHYYLSYIYYFVSWENFNQTTIVEDQATEEVEEDHSIEVLLEVEEEVEEVLIKGHQLLLSLMELIFINVRMHLLSK